MKVSHTVMRQARDEAAASWCMRLSDDELLTADRAAFDRWIENDANAAAFEHALVVWQGVDAAAHLPQLIHIRGEALEKVREAQQRRWAPRYSRSWRWAALGAAAAALVAMLVTVIVLSLPDVYETGTGERRVAMLDDGSKISLDAGTRVEVQMTAARRELRLVSGRAKFDVAKDPLRPFSVAVSGKMVVATGTSFSVELLRRQMRVVLYEGHVSVLQQGAGRRQPREIDLPLRRQPADQILLPGHELVAPLDASTATVTLVDLQRSLAWESGQLSFENEPLPSAIERVNRYSATKLSVADPTINTRINGVFTAGDTDAFVEGVAALHPVVIERSPERINLTLK